MLKQKPETKSAFSLVLPLFGLLILLGLLISARALAEITYYPSDFDVSSGAYFSGSVPASLLAVDSDYLTVGSSLSATSASSYNPWAYGRLGGTTYVSGTTGDLASDDNVHMIYRSYPSVTIAQALYAHQEATTIGGNPYYTQRPEPANLSGTNLSVSMATTGRHLLGRFVYPLTGLSSLPASTWTGFYRAWRDSDPNIAYDSAGAGNNGDGTSSITWTHVVGSGSNRFMVIGISVRTVTVFVSSVAVDGQSATFLRSDVRGTEVKGEIWYLINPNMGTKTVNVTLSGVSKASGGSVSYTGVEQTSPIDNHGSVSYGGTTASISLTTTTNNDWIFSNLAICGTATISAHGSGQVHRYYQVGTGGAGSSRAGADGDDKPTTAPSSYTMSWNMSFWSDVIAQSVALKPAPPPVGHVDVDIVILQSDGAIRTTIATNSASSGDIPSTPETLSGSYAASTYTVVNQTDYLEIDYYAEVTAATSGLSAYLRIDDVALPTTDQTRIANVMLPSEHTVEAELTGASNGYNWTQLLWTLDSSWTTSSVTVTVQLYSCTLSRYPINGDGFIAYTSSATPNTDETREQVITSNSQQFRDAAGNWKVRVRGVKSVNSPFDLKVDWAEFRPTYHGEYAASTEFVFSSLTNDTATRLEFTVVSEYDVGGVSISIQVWNHSSSAYVSSGQGFLRYISSGANETRMLTIDTNPRFYASNGTAKIRITSLLSTTVPYQQKTNQVKLDYISSTSLDWPTTFLYVLPLPFAAGFLWFIMYKRRKNNKRSIKNPLTAFSEQFGMTHQQMIGQKMLLEIDPASDYNMALSSFVSEAKNNGETLFVVTNWNSVLHSVFSSAANVNFLLLTSKTHYPQQISERETILPASDLSVLLDTCVKMQQTYTGKTVNLLLDNLSDIILRCDFDKTYKFTRLLLEAISNSKTTALFVFVPTAHDQEVSSSVRSLFHTQLAYTKNGPKAANI